MISYDSVFDTVLAKFKETDEEEEIPYPDDAALDEDALNEFYDEEGKKYTNLILGALIDGATKYVDKLGKIFNTSDTKQIKEELNKTENQYSAPSLQPILMNLWNDGWETGGDHAVAEVNTLLEDGNTEFAAIPDLAEFKSRAARRREEAEEKYYLAYPPKLGTPIPTIKPLQQALENRTLVLAQDVNDDMRDRIDGYLQDAIKDHEAQRGLTLSQRKKLANRINGLLLYERGRQADDGIPADERVRTQIPVPPPGSGMVNRSRMIANTELSASYNMGRLTTYAKTGVVTHVRWQAVGDLKTCAVCRSRNGTVIPLPGALTQNAAWNKSKVRNPKAISTYVLPAHPNDRCAWQPATKAMIAAAGRQPESRQKKTKKQNAGWVVSGAISAATGIAGGIKAQLEYENEKERQKRRSRNKAMIAATGVLGLGALGLLAYNWLKQDGQPGRPPEVAPTRQQEVMSTANEVTKEITRSLAEQALEQMTDEGIRKTLDQQMKDRFVAERRRANEIRLSPTYPSQVMNEKLQKKYPQLLSAGVDLKNLPDKDLADRYGMSVSDIQLLRRLQGHYESDLATITPFQKSMPSHALPASVLSDYPWLANLADVRQLTIEQIQKRGIPLPEAVNLHRRIQKSLNKQAGLTMTPVYEQRAIREILKAAQKGDIEFFRNLLPSSRKKRAPKGQTQEDVARRLMERVQSAIAKGEKIKSLDQLRVYGLGKKSLNTIRSQYAGDAVNINSIIATQDRATAVELIANKLGAGQKLAQLVYDVALETGQQYTPENFYPRLLQRAQEAGLEFNEGHVKKAIKNLYALPGLDRPAPSLPESPQPPDLAGNATRGDLPGGDNPPPPPRNKDIAGTPTRRSLPTDSPVAQGEQVGTDTAKNKEVAKDRLTKIRQEALPQVGGLSDRAIPVGAGSTQIDDTARERAREQREVNRQMREAAERAEREAKRQEERLRAEREAREREEQAREEARLLKQKYQEGKRRDLNKAEDQAQRKADNFQDAIESRAGQTKFKRNQTVGDRARELDREQAKVKNQAQEFQRRAAIENDDQVTREVETEIQQLDQRLEDAKSEPLNDPYFNNRDRANPEVDRKIRETEDKINKRVEDIDRELAAPKKVRRELNRVQQHLRELRRQVETNLRSELANPDSPLGQEQRKLLADLDRHLQDIDNLSPDDVGDEFLQARAPAIRNTIQEVKKNQQKLKKTRIVEDIDRRIDEINELRKNTTLPTEKRESLQAEKRRLLNLRKRLGTMPRKKSDLTTQEATQIEEVDRRRKDVADSRSRLDIILKRYRQNRDKLGKEIGKLLEDTKYHSEIYRSGEYDKMASRELNRYAEEVIKKAKRIDQLAERVDAATGTDWFTSESDYDFFQAVKDPRYVQERIKSGEPRENVTLQEALDRRRLYVDDLETLLDKAYQGIGFYQNPTEITLIAKLKKQAQENRSKLIQMRKRVIALRSSTLAEINQESENLKRLEAGIPYQELGIDTWLKRIRKETIEFERVLVGRMKDLEMFTARADQDARRKPQHTGGYRETFEVEDREDGAIAKPITLAPKNQNQLSRQVRGEDGKGSVKDEKMLKATYQKATEQYNEAKKKIARDRDNFKQLESGINKVIKSGVNVDSLSTKIKNNEDLTEPQKKALENLSPEEQEVIRNMAATGSYDAMIAIARAEVAADIIYRDSAPPPTTEIQKLGQRLTAPFRPKVRRSLKTRKWEEVETEIKAIARWSSTSVSAIRNLLVKRESDGRIIFDRAEFERLAFTADRLVINEGALNKAIARLSKLIGLTETGAPLPLDTAKVRKMAEGMPSNPQLGSYTYNELLIAEEANRLHLSALKANLSIDNLRPPLTKEQKDAYNVKKQREKAEAEAKKQPKAEKNRYGNFRCDRALVGFARHHLNPSTLKPFTRVYNRGKKAKVLWR